MQRTAAPTEKVKTRRQQAHDAGLFRLLVDRIVDYAIFLLSPEGHVLSWNSGAERLKGYTVEEIIGESFERFYTPEDRETGRPVRLLEAARSDGRAEDIGWRVRKDGTRFWADVVITALRDEHGQLRAFAKVTRDLSDRREAEEQLRRSEERLRTLVDSVKDYAIFMLSPEGIVLTWNQGARALKGYAPEEIIGQSFSRFYTEEGRAAGRPDYLLNIARTEGRVEDEGWRVRKDGTLFWADVVITALRDEQGQLLGFAKVTRDLTERRRAEEDRAARMAAERTAQRFERLQMATAALAAASRPETAAEVLTDISLRAVDAAVVVAVLPNAAGTALRVVSVRGEPWWVQTDPEQEIDVNAAHWVAHAWRRRGPLFVVSRLELDAAEPELSAMLGEPPGRAWGLVPLMIGQRMVGLLGLRFDGPRALDQDERGFLLAIAEVGAQALDRARLYAAEQLARTESESAERAAREEAELVETLHRVSLALSSHLELGAVVQAVTDAATAAAGAEFGAFFYNVLDAQGESYTLYTLSGAPREAFERFPMPRNTAVFEPTFRGTEVVRIDDVLLDSRYGKNPPYAGMPAGHLPVRSYLAVPVKSKSGNVLGGLFFGHSARGVFTDRAERLAVGIAAQAGVAMDNARLYEQVQQAVETRDVFLAAAAHDLKTPIAATKGIAQVLRRRIDRMQLPAAQSLAEGLSRIDQSVERMTGLIDELLDLTRLQMGRPLDLERQATNLGALARQVLADQEPNAPRHRLSVVESRDPVVGFWDQLRLRRVLDNLVVNAVKYSPQGGEVLVRIDTIQTDQERAAIVQVTDHGVGIPAADLPHIFERFRRGGNVAFIHGTGIGLGIAMSIVQQHGGSLSVDSVEGQGSTFTVRLPLE